MSVQIVEEARFFMYSVVMGVLVSVIYDVIRIIRRVIVHNKAAVAFEDILFWLITLLLMFFCLYDMNYGVLRWFSVAGVIIGIKIYKKIFGEHLVDLLSAILNRILDIVLQVFKWLLKPFVLLKKKLTELKNLVKLNITERIKPNTEMENEYDSQNL